MLANIPMRFIKRCREQGNKNFVSNRHSKSLNTKGVYMRNQNKLFLLITFSLLLTTNLLSQQWTAEQKDVWAGVEKYWAVSTSDNPMDFLNYFDDSYLGWSYDMEVPGNKSDAVKSLNYWLKKGKVQYYVIKPSAIWVNGDFAYVHYHYEQVMEGTSGVPMQERGRWTDILMKKNGTWMLVGDHGGEIENDD